MGYFDRRKSMNEIAYRLLAWGMAEDPYGFKDCYDSHEEALAETLKDFDDKDRLQGNITYLSEYIAENPEGDPDLINEAYELIRMIQEWMREN